MKKQIKPKDSCTKSDSVDCCTLCGRKTEYTRETPIDRRFGYIEGAGQLCRDCYMDTYQIKRTQGESQ